MFTYNMFCVSHNMFGVSHNMFFVSQHFSVTHVKAKKFFNVFKLAKVKIEVVFLF